MEARQGRESKEGRKEEARRRGRSRKGRKEEARQGGGRVGRPFERGAAFAPQGSSLTSKRYKSGRKYEGHLDGH